MVFTAEKMHRMKIGAIVGAVLGLFVFFIAWAATKNLASAFIIPAGALIGAAQGSVNIDRDDDE